MASVSSLKIFGVLAKHGVNFIVVGGVSAVLRGVPINTFDVDIVHLTSPENVDRLLSALEELDAYYRIQPDRRLRPNSSHLSGSGHQLLTTRFGYLDCLGSVSKKRTYADLLPESDEMKINAALVLKVLKLEMLIALKEEVGHPKDVAVLHTLKATLEEIRSREKKIAVSEEKT
jgi:hypothetical protein